MNATKSSRPSEAYSKPHIVISQLSAAILTYNNDILLQKRPEDAKIFAGMWSIPGGKIEKHEHNDPYTACLREIKEETGISQEDISDINLKYIFMRRYVDEIRVMYVYHFDLNKKAKEIDTPEGMCRWLKINEALDVNTSFGVKEILRHFCNNEITDTIYTGTVFLRCDEPAVTWSKLSNWTDYN